MAASSIELTWPQVHTWRMRRQLLLPEEAGDGDPGGDGGDGVVADVDATRVAHRLCGVQAQVMSAAQLAVAVRGGEPASLGAGLAEGRLLRTWAMRGTLHVLRPADAAACLALVAAARTWAKPSWQRTFVTLDQLDALAAAVTAALADGVPRTRDELVAHVEEETGDGHLAEQLRSSWGAALKPLAWQGLLCQGPSRGSRVTFVRPVDAVRDWPGLPDADAAARQVLPAYLAAYGPADAAAFDAWLLRGGTAKATLRRWVADLGEELTTVQVEGRPLLARTGDVDELAGTRPTTAVRLLGGFDQFVLGPGTADPHVVPASHRADVSRTAGWIAPVVVTADGVVGTWESADGDVVVHAFADRPQPEPAALTAEVRRVRGLLGATSGP